MPIVLNILAVKQVKQGKLSAAEICEKCIERVSKIRELNAFITETSSVARHQLEASRQNKPTDNRLLEGIPVAVKDNFCTKSTRTTCASRMLENFVPPYSATVVQRMFDHGSLLIGKTNMDEFAMGCGSTDSIFGPVRNPWKYRFKKQVHEKGAEEHLLVGQQCSKVKQSGRSIHTCHLEVISQTDLQRDDEWFISGGSSGGSAVAVATGASFGALGSDTGGSTRNPASLCGVVGFKPTYGLVSRYGLIPLVNSMDVPGILARTVDDANILYNSIAGHDLMDSTTIPETFHPKDLSDRLSVSDLHIGIPKVLDELVLTGHTKLDGEYFAPGLSDEVRAAWIEVADMFEKAGAHVSQVSMPHTQYSIITYSILCASEVASNMARYDGIEFGHRANNEESTESLYAQSRHEGFSDVVRGRIFAGNYFLLKENFDRYYMQAQKVRRLIANDFSKVFLDGIDVLLTPTTPAMAPLYSWFSQADNRTRTAELDVFTQPANMAGVPAVSIPIKLSSEGLPISLQIMGQRFKDHQMLSVAKWLEQQVNFKHLNLDFLDLHS